MFLGQPKVNVSCIPLTVASCDELLLGQHLAVSNLLVQAAHVGDVVLFQTSQALGNEFWSSLESWLRGGSLSTETKTHTASSEK